MRKDVFEDEKKVKEEFNSKMKKEFPKGTMWQNLSSLGEDGLVDVYAMFAKWELIGRIKYVEG